MADFRDDSAFASRYRDMTDAELLKLASSPWEISDAAWDALEEELESRGLEIPVPDVEVPEKRNLLVIRRFRDLPEAMLAKGKLESQGLDSFIADDNMVRMDWLWSNLVGGVKLLVDAEDEERALRVLDEAIPAEIDFEGETEYLQPRCPNCKSLDINFEEVYKPIAYASLIVNFPLPVQRKGWVCQNCQHTWQENPIEQKEESREPPA